MYGRGPLGAQRFCKECTERCTHLSLVVYLTSREEVSDSVHWGYHKIFFLGGGGGGGGGAGTPPTHTR